MSLRSLLLMSAVAVITGPAPVTAGTAQAAAQPATVSRPLTVAERVTVVRTAADQFEQYYVFADKGKQIATQLRGPIARAAPNAPAEPKAFAEWLTAQLRRVGNDRHLELAPPAASATPTAQQSRAGQLSWLDRLRRRNYDFVRIERLSGNVGYLRLNSFPPPEVAGETAAATMAVLKHSDALIIDLRGNGGGTGEMVRFLASYFFAVPTRLSRTFRRHGAPQVTYDTTMTTIPGQRMPLIDLFILTGGDTFSAAEAFAFALQEHRRAEIVGEKTRGGGNAGDYLDAGHGFSVFVPDVAVSSPFGERSWEGVGVQPDIPAQVSQALDVAHRLAVERLMAAASDPAARELYQRALNEMAVRPTR
jgi:hypothetical protein